MKYLRRSLLCTVLTAALISLFMLGAAAAAKETNEISSLTLNKSRTDLNFEIQLTADYVKEHKNMQLGLFELLPHQSTSELGTMSPVKTFKVAEKVRFTLPYIVGNMNRLYSKFVVAGQAADGSWNIVTPAKYIENTSMLAENNAPYPTGSSKKGLQVQLFGDAQQLGVQHTVINVPVNEYILGENSDAAMSFVYNGQTFYLDKTRIATLDHRVKTYTEAGINVYFNLILTASPADAHPTVRSLYYENADPAAALFALNTRSETAMKAFQAFVDYFCARYTRADHAYGFVPALILGFEVNNNRVWNNAGSMDMAQAVYSYCTAFRVTYTAMNSHYSEGRVYISLGSNFASAASEPSIAVDPALDYPAKEFLSIFAGAIKNSGDLPWGVSINPYASDPSMTQYWSDTYAEDNADTPFITMKNIGVLTDFLAQEDYLYDGDMRSVIIGEFGISGDPADEASLTMQAAAYALAYFTAARNEHIDAFIYHRHVDHSGESQYYGLWSNAAGTTMEPAAKKTIYNVFAQIDTERCEEVTSFVKQTVGSGAWDLAMNDKVKYKEFNARTVLAALAASPSDYAKGYTAKVLFDLTGGKLCDFYPADDVEYVELRPTADGAGTMLYAKLKETPTVWEGISNSMPAEGELKDAHYITLRVMAAAPEGAGEMSLMLRLGAAGDAKNDAVTFEGEARIVPGQWQEISFRVKDFAALTDGDADMLKLWLRTDDAAAAAGEYGLWLESVTVHTRGGLGWLLWILVILLALVVLAVLAYGVLFLRAQYIRAQRRKQRQAMMERRRQEMMRMQAMQQQRPPQQPPYGRPPRTSNDNQFRGDDY